VRLTIVRDAKGQTAGAVIGQITTTNGVQGVHFEHPNGMHATVVAGPGQTLEEVEVPDSLQQFVGTDPVEFQRQLRVHVPNS
jgi:hypothetical protein